MICLLIYKEENVSQCSYQHLNVSVWSELILLQYGPFSNNKLLEILILLDEYLLPGWKNKIQIFLIIKNSQFLEFLIHRLNLKYYLELKIV
jgi:hypothetical protein